METLLSKHWHAIAAEDVQRFLETDMEKGLDRLEVSRRQEHFGPNIITGQKKTNPLILFLQQFNQALVFILIGAGAITFILQEYVEAVFIFGVVLVNAAIGFVQEYKALTSIEALAQTMETEAKTIRAGRPHRIDAAGLVPGDIVILQSGDKVPADLRLFDFHALRIDPRPPSLANRCRCLRRRATCWIHDIALADRRNMAYASTLVTLRPGRWHCYRHWRCH